MLGAYPRIGPPPKTPQHTTPQLDTHTENPHPHPTPNPPNHTLPTQTTQPNPTHPTTTPHTPNKPHPRSRNCASQGGPSARIEQSTRIHRRRDRGAIEHLYEIPNCELPGGFGGSDM